MSTLNGTATDYNDLLNQFRTFVTTDATLVSLGQNWTEEKYNNTPYNVVDNGQTNQVIAETYLKAPGLSGAEAIYMQLQCFQNTGNNMFNWRLRGAVGFLSSADWFNQPGASPDQYAYMWNQPITFWFVANGQRAIIVAKVSTIYVPIYIGKFLPYGTPSQYPYPLFIGGTGNATDSLANANLRFSDSSTEHRSFFDPAAALYCHPDGSWQHLSNWVGGFGTTNIIWPWNFSITARQRFNFLDVNLDGSYSVFPARFVVTSPSLNVLGEFDGVGFVTGFSNASENQLTIGPDTWFVFQDTFRNALDNFCAIKWS